MTLTIRRAILALTLGVSGLALALPLTSRAPALAAQSISKNGTSGLLADLNTDPKASAGQLLLASNDGHDDAGSEAEDRDDEGEGAASDDGGKAVSSSTQATFQEGCAITDVKCLQQTGK